MRGKHDGRNSHGPEAINVGPVSLRECVRTSLRQERRMAGLGETRWHGRRSVRDVQFHARLIASWTSDFNFPAWQCRAGPFSPRPEMPSGKVWR